MLRFLLISLLSSSVFANFQIETTPQNQNCYNQYKAELKDYFHPGQFATAPMAGGMAAVTATLEATALGAAASGGVVGGAVIVIFATLGTVQGIQNAPERRMMRLIKDSVLYNELQTDPGRALKKITKKIRKALLKKGLISEDDKNAVTNEILKSLSAQIVLQNRSGVLCKKQSDDDQLPRFKNLVNNLTNPIEVIEVAVE